MIISKKRFSVRVYSIVCYVVLLVGFPLCLHAQSWRAHLLRDAESTHSGSLRHQFSVDSAHIYRYRPIHFLLALDFRQTWIGLPNNDDIPVRLRSVKAGVIIHERHRTGLGYSIIHNANLTDKNGVPVHLRFHALSAFYEYYFIHRRHWSVGAPVEVGVGRYKAEGQDPRLDGKSVDVTAAGTGLHLHYRPIKWLAFNTSGGYRYAFNDGPIDLNNWFFSIGVSVPLGHLLQDMRYRRRENQLYRQIEYDMKD